MDYIYGSSHLLSTKDSHYRLTNGQTVPMARSGEAQVETLIQLSGGIDSTYVLWKWLSENPDKLAAVHHINLKSIENRWSQELESVDKILKWLDSNGLKNYIYLENTFDYGNIPSTIYDVELCGFIAGFILRSVRFIETNKTHLPIYGATTEREERRRQVLSFTAKREIECIYPLYGREKWEIIEELPEELMELTWYCRSPLNEKKCGICFSCREVENSLRIIEENKLKKYLEGN
jgi:7-cyano-7-deazaguanine synthase in queuosine biosynthesis